MIIMLYECFSVNIADYYCIANFTNHKGLLQ